MGKSGKKKNKASGTPASQGAAGRVQSRNPSHEDGASQGAAGTPSHEDGATTESWSMVAARGNKNPAAHRGQTPVTNGGSSNNGSRADKPEEDSSSSDSSNSSGDDDSSSGEEEEEKEEATEEGEVTITKTTPPPSTDSAIPPFLQNYVKSALRRAEKKGTEPPDWVFKLIGMHDTADQQTLIDQVNPTNLAVDLNAETSSRGSGRVPSANGTSNAPSGHSRENTPTLENMRTSTQTRTSSTESPASLPLSTPSVRTNDTIMPVERRSLENAKFQLKQTDIPSDLKLEGLPHEDIPEKMALYRARIAILSGSVGSCNVSQETIDYRAIQNLGLFVRGAAAESLNLILASALEWRPEARLEALRARGVRIEIAPPTTWSEWVTAFTTLFAPANRISLLAREVMTLQAKLGEGVDMFSLRVTQAYARLIEEAKRTAPPNISPHEHALEQAKIASFENGLPPEVRVELIREDPSQTFMKSKARARKHEANKMRSVSDSASTSISALSNPPPHTQMVEQQCEILHQISALQARLSNNSRGGYKRSQPATDGAGSQAPPAKKPAGQQNGKKGKGKAGVKGGRQQGGTGGGASGGPSKPTECTYLGCRNHERRFSHTRANCRIEADHLANGLELTEK